MTASEWQLGLVEHGAVIADGAVSHFVNTQNGSKSQGENQVLSESNIKSEIVATKSVHTLCDLTHLGLLELGGAEAVSFLQGQVTNDVKLLVTNNIAHYSGYCTPKGRLLALFLAFSHDDHLHLQFNRALLEPIMKRLKMYVMRSKVEIKDVSETIIKFGINGPDSAALLTPFFSQIPTQDYELVSLDNGAILKLPTIAGHTRFQIFTDAINAPILFNALKVNCQLVGKPCWDWLDIQSGIPDVSAKTQEQFVPQMLNLDILNGINFKKGCYTGQEIVARMHYLGKVKRRTYLASIQSSTAPVEGDKVLDATNNDIGQIVRIAPNDEAGFDALIELRIEAKQAGNLTWQDSAINIKPLPYALNDEPSLLDNLLE
ncbi:MULTISPECIES: CAF17-like 4Fe-4S cluster assembly/insertion protein YgfZ [Methylotenera]|uniref:CAF17-like 4Fe-4S cluster assembly/insertion protein YgfZ n=1 Tax=Methylotenera TaxID=359407 RepID=UPI0003638541|nr:MULTISPECIES: folate-binding protein YgfZ [Methylotenera]